MVLFPTAGGRHEAAYLEHAARSMWSPKANYASRHELLFHRWLLGR